MSKNLKTKILTLAMPSTKAQKKNCVVEILKGYIKDFKPDEQICFSAFLNMICQTENIVDLLKLQYNEFRGLPNILEIINDGDIIYYRDTLLCYINQIISADIYGDSKITGHDNYLDEFYINYGKCLLYSNWLIDNLKPELIQKRLFMLESPFFTKEIINWIYFHRLIRYSYMYTKTISQLERNKKSYLLKGISKLEKEHNIKICDYYKILFSIYNWFVRNNYNKLKESTDNEIKLGFNKENIETFYIRKKRFEKYPQFINVLDFLSSDFKEFKDIIKLLRHDTIDNNVFKNIQCLFDSPVFKVSDEDYCILDLKFLLDKSCSGFRWLLHGLIEKDVDVNVTRKICDENGYLVESYFLDISKRMFGTDIEASAAKKNKPDAIIRKSFGDEDYIIIIEFTTKSYRIASLYNKKATSFNEDIERILFKDDSSDKGKFINLNKYFKNISEGCSDNTKIIPVLITETYFGDYDLLNMSPYCISEFIKSKNLEFLEKNKPVVLCLEDLELFWRVTEQKTLTEVFISKLVEWNLLKNKGEYFFRFSSFITEKSNGAVNGEYKKIFNDNYMLDFCCSENND